LFFHDIPFTYNGTYVRRIYELSSKL
jgi:hypothetical protein